MKLHDRMHRQAVRLVLAVGLPLLLVFCSLNPQSEPPGMRPELSDDTPTSNGPTGAGPTGGHANAGESEGASPQTSYDASSPVDRGGITDCDAADSAADAGPEAGTLRGSDSGCGSLGDSGSATKSRAAQDGSTGD